MNNKVPPRIYCIPATKAPIVAVFRRGPTNWSHIGRWDLVERRYESGAWLRGRIYPRRSDLSPNGRFLCYFAFKSGSKWEHGMTYVALSKLPWLDRAGKKQLLNDIQWADWDQEGNLLVATQSGKLQIRTFNGDCSDNGDRSEVLFEEDISLSEPDPVPAPAWAQEW